MLVLNSKIACVALLSAIVLLTQSGCQAGYLVKSAYSQADLLRRRVPLERALEDPDLGEEQKRKLRLAKDTRLFAENELGLKPTQNYTSYVQLDRPYVTYVVSAAPKNELTHHLWSYPLVGAMPYKGFFDPGDAKEEAEKLRKQGLDTYVRGVSAYSTLGWFKDPILSSMLNYRDYDLVNTIIHETVHSTVFIKSEADFNESLATFIGNKGTEAFYQKLEGDSGSTLAAMQADGHDEQVFSNFISAELESMKTWYEERKGQTIPEEIRRARFQEIQKRFRDHVRPKLKAPNSYMNFETSELNNAQLLTYKLYLNDLHEFEALFQKLGGDFKKMVEFCKSLESVQDPKSALTRALAQP